MVSQLKTLYKTAKTLLNIQDNAKSEENVLIGSDIDILTDTDKLVRFREEWMRGMKTQMRRLKDIETLRNAEITLNNDFEAPGRYSVALERIFNRISPNFTVDTGTEDHTSVALTILVLQQHSHVVCISCGRIRITNVLSSELKLDEITSVYRLQLALRSRLTSTDSRVTKNILKTYNHYKLTHRPIAAACRVLGISLNRMLLQETNKPLFVHSSIGDAALHIRDRLESFKG